ncbi:MAG TPA: hypothetical protein VEZ40_00040 [Pyrinomonadaceae bacterium]|nr:hypothetical protein [Pyrinomonadaceae bacterium]
MILAAFCLGGGVAATVKAQEPAQSRSLAGAPPDVDAIIRAFTAKETEFSRALNNYGFKRDAVIQTVGAGGQVTGEYRRASQFSFDDRGGRYERINHFPQPTLTEVSFTQEDLEDLGGVQPFALEASKLDRYKFTYVGKERIDELDLYVFDVAPKVMPKKITERLFQGRVWVDDQDLQIVKVRGKGVPEGNQRFPIFETYREQVDGRYWFPTYTSVDDVLEFPNGQTTHLRMTVRYMDYRRFKGSVKIIEEGEPGIAP